MAKKWLNYAAMVLLFFAGIGVAKRDEIAGYFNPRSYRGGDRAVVLQLDEDFSSDLPPLPDVEDDGPAEGYAKEPPGDEPATGSPPSEESNPKKPEHILSDVADIRFVKNHGKQIFLDGIDINVDGSYDYDFTKKEHVALAYAEALACEDMDARNNLLKRIMTEKLIERRLAKIKRRIKEWEGCYEEGMKEEPDHPDLPRVKRMAENAKREIYDDFPVFDIRRVVGYNRVGSGKSAETTDTECIRINNENDGIRVQHYLRDHTKTGTFLYDLFGTSTIYLTPEDGEWKINKIKL